ncbi:hypothetical protein HHI36_014081 [Cryptolaemus montrouzieri]|uniref:Uncharacterized protein n=1 Tax=Cryptolaemus montrouzieri TaxID=559131 RepID=A0ABD2N1F8_9CUCU
MEVPLIPRNFLNGGDMSSKILRKKKCEEIKNSIFVLHQNIQSLKYKVLDLDLLLGTMEFSRGVVCITEHWLAGSDIQGVHIPAYELVSYFSRVSLYGGSCVCICGYDDGKSS